MKIWMALQQSKSEVCQSQGKMQTWEWTVECGTLLGQIMPINLLPTTSYTMGKWESLGPRELFGTPTVVPRGVDDGVSKGDGGGEYH
jgi:hypothetical protein